MQSPTRCTRSNHLKRKGTDAVGDYDDVFSPVPAAMGWLRLVGSLKL